jgi:hypothetical protein
MWLDLRGLLLSAPSLGIRVRFCEMPLHDPWTVLSSAPTNIPNDRRVLLFQWNFRKLKRSLPELKTKLWELGTPRCPFPEHREVRIRWPDREGENREGERRLLMARPSLNPDRNFSAGYTRDPEIDRLMNEPAPLWADIVVIRSSVSE